jgi:hypothetical protein
MGLVPACRSRNRHTLFTLNARSAGCPGTAKSVGRTVACRCRSRTRRGERELRRALNTLLARLCQATLLWRWGFRRSYPQPSPSHSLAPRRQAGWLHDTPPLRGRPLTAHRARRVCDRSRPGASPPAASPDRCRAQVPARTPAQAHQAGREANRRPRAQGPAAVSRSRAITVPAAGPAGPDRLAGRLAGGRTDAARVRAEQQHGRDRRRTAACAGAVDAPL